MINPELLRIDETYRCKTEHSFASFVRPFKLNSISPEVTFTTN